MPNYKKLNVCRADTFTKKGETKEITKWKIIGEITEFENGNKILELYHLPYKYQIFKRFEEIKK